MSCVQVKRSHDHSQKICQKYFDTYNWHTVVPRKASGTFRGGANATLYRLAASVTKGSRAHPREKGTWEESCSILVDLNWGCAFYGLPDLSEGSCAVSDGLHANDRKIGAYAYGLSCQLGRLRFTTRQTTQRVETHPQLCSNSFKSISTAAKGNLSPVKVPRVYL